MADTLTPPPVPDRFEHETPLRAFTDWNETGMYAIGKGLRPSAKHLPVYLDAIERKEGWQLVQMLLDDQGNFRSAIFRRDPAKLVERYREAHPAIVETIEYHGVTPMRDHKTESTHEMRQCGATDTVGGPVLGETPKTDDPVNPKHYGGTACAEIGERLTANCYQVLKYCWRLGEKDDPKIELGKAIWYARREKDLGPPRSRGSGGGLYSPGLKPDFIVERTQDNPWRRQIAVTLGDMCYGYGSAEQWQALAEELIETLEDKLARTIGAPPCTTGLAV